jgi:hypothetical protein
MRESIDIVQGRHCAFFQRFVPNAEKVGSRAKAAGIDQLSVSVMPQDAPQGILLWPRSNAT